jgi:hypothetical protein
MVKNQVADEKRVGPAISLLSFFFFGSTSFIFIFFCLHLIFSWIIIFFVLFHSFVFRFMFPIMYKF